MTGGQSIDLRSEGQSLSSEEMETLHYLKTGALIRSAVMSACCVAPNLSEENRAALDGFARDIGLAFQIRDDILDVAGETGVIGKRTGADKKLAKATWPSQFGLEAANRRCDELVLAATDRLAPFGKSAESLKSLAAFIVERVS